MGKEYYRVVVDVGRSGKGKARKEVIEIDITNRKIMMELSAHFVKYSWVKRNCKCL
jgi:hypothetical protein